MKKKFDEETNMTVLNRQRKLEICRENQLCFYCPMHGGENARGKPPRSDKYKNRRKERLKERISYEN